MRSVIYAALGFLLMGIQSAHSEEYSNTNVYVIRNSVIRIELYPPVKREVLVDDPFRLSVRGNKQETTTLDEFECNLGPESEIRLIREDENYIYAKILLSSAWDTTKDYSKTGRIFGACNPKRHIDIRFPKNKKFKENGILHFFRK